MPTIPCLSGRLGTANWRQTCLGCVVLLLVSCTSSTTHDVFNADISGTPAPWTHLQFINEPADFQFAIVSDRTGGHRPGVFPAVLDRVNLLQPEFIMSVGDYIEGYSSDAHVLAKQWAEIDAMITRLDAPFFYVPGNHDHSNTAMADLWQTRFGKSWYHFVYRNVLFLVLNTEDPYPENSPEIDAAWEKVWEVLRTNPDGARNYIYNTPELAPVLGRISDDQRDEIVRAINAHPDVRWTFLFMHRPIWNKMAPSNYLAIEEALQGRNYTAFAGHEHSYLYLRRHGQDHMTLGTSGGGWTSAPPARQGQFDHFTWVTMRDQGPMFAHILASGVFEKEGPPPFIPGAELCGGDTNIQCVYQEFKPAPTR